MSDTSEWTPDVSKLPGPPEKQHQWLNEGCASFEVTLTAKLATAQARVADLESMFDRLVERVGPAEKASRALIKMRDMPPKWKDDLGRFGFLCMLCKAWAYVEDGALSIKHTDECLYTFLLALIAERAAVPQQRAALGEAAGER